MKHKKLVIISHTEHYKNQENMVVGWGATINEINFLADYWEEIVHIGCLYKTEAPKSALPYSQKNIQFVALPPYGGKTIVSKIGILIKIPRIIFTVVRNIKNTTEVQLRLPTSMGLFLLPLFSFFLPRKYTFWVKYAGNWKQENPPISYKIQRWWLKNNLAKCKVTINGFWKNQPKHCLSFENPCLTDEEIIFGKKVIENKQFTKPFTLCFIGRLDEAKGVDVLIQSLQKVALDAIETIHFIGDSEKREAFENKAAFLGKKVQFHGFLDKESVHKILEKSHFLILPSRSEGFPKVIAEAACYGTIPIVSNVGSISHYVSNNNGFLWNINATIGFDEILKAAFSVTKEELEKKAKNVANLAEKFTFTNYIQKLNTEILNKQKPIQ